MRGAGGCAREKKVFACGDLGSCVLLGAGRVSLQVRDGKWFDGKGW
jgi:hypothetical protein